MDATEIKEVIKTYFDAGFKSDGVKIGKLFMKRRIFTELHLMGA